MAEQQQLEGLLDQELLLADYKLMKDIHTRMWEEV